MCQAFCGLCTSGPAQQVGSTLRQFSAEVTIVGGHQVAAAGGHGATIMSYATRGNLNEFNMWNPDSLTVEVQGTDYDTHVNVNDGADHRITATWDSATGRLTVYDNGAVVSQFDNVLHGGAIAGNGKLVLGQDQDSYGGGFEQRDAYQGQVVSATLAHAAPSAATVAKGPLATTLPDDPNVGLITNVVIGPDGRPIDTTGRATYTTEGAMTAPSVPISTGLYVSADCQ
jgi:hypothetical protein